MPKSKFLSLSLSLRDGRLAIDFEPIVDRQSTPDLRLIAPIQHQVLGLMAGTAVLGDGETLHFETVPDVAEDVFNKW